MENPKSANDNSGLASREDWQAYWAERPTPRIGRRFYYRELLEHALREKPYRTFIELGGFPGMFAVYVTRIYGYEATLLDSYVDRDVLHEFLAANDIAESAIDVLEGDLFEVEPPQRFDVVLSAGLIEHFADTRAVLERHLAFLRPGGTLIVTLPNFRGINGWLQARFDPPLLERHNLEIMDLAVLRSLLGDFDLASFDVFYYGRFRVWLEELSRYPFHVKLLVRALRATGMVFDLFRIKSRLTSRDIAIVARAR